MTSAGWSSPGVCVSDLAVFGLEHLFDRGLLKRDEIDALILVTADAGPFHAAHEQHHSGASGLEAGHAVPGHQPGLRRVL